MVKDINLFDDYETLSRPLLVEVGDKNKILAIARGRVGTLRNVLHVPNLARNLISVKQLAKDGCKVVFYGEKVMLEDSNGVSTVIGGLFSNLYTLDEDAMPLLLKNKNSDSNLDVEKSYICYNRLSDTELYHQRFTHVSHNVIRNIVKNKSVSGIKILDGSLKLPHFCEHCALSKATIHTPKHELSTSQERRIRRDVDLRLFFQVLSSDVLGPMQVQGLNGARYAVTFTEHKSRYRWLYSIRTKEQVLEKFKLLLAEIEARGFKVTTFHTDNGGEYTSAEFENFLRNEKKIIPHRTPPNTPQANAVTERFNRVLGERARALLKASNLPKMLWPQAMSTVVYVYNRLPSPGNTRHEYKTPYELLYGTVPDISHLRIFGCDAYAYNFDVSRQKLDDTAIKGVFVGYDDKSSSYLVYIPNNRKIMRSAHVIFNERGFYAPGVISDGASDDDWKLMDDDDLEQQNNKPVHTNLDTVTEKLKNVEIDDNSVPNTLAWFEARDLEEQTKSNDIQVEKSNADTSDAGVDTSTQPRRSGRNRKPNPRYAYLCELVRSHEASKIAHITEVYALLVSENTPTDPYSDYETPSTLEEALSGPYAREWRTAIDLELSQIEKYKIWRKVVKPHGAHVVGTKWVFKIKRKKDHSIDKFRARLVVKGYAQVKGVDYNELFSPVIRITSLRTLLSLATAQEWDIDQLDVHVAFFNGELDEDIYISEPDGAGYGLLPGEVLKLDKALYGLKQAPRCWNKELTNFLIECKFRRCITDPCIFIKQSDNGVCIIGVYVDDMLVMGDDKTEIASIKENLKNRFEIDDLGPARYCLGLEIDRDIEAKTIKLSQRASAEKLLKKFRCSDARVREKCIPYTPKQDVEDPEEPIASELPFRECVGAQLYLSTCTRPDLAFAVSSHASHNTKPTRRAWKRVMQTNKYINATKENGIVYHGDINDAERNQIRVYVDADHAGDLRTRKSRTGYIVMMNGGPISWTSRLQSLVALSSTEAEYYAITDAVQEALWLRSLLSELGFPQRNATDIFEDNKGARDLCRNPIFQKRTRHIEIKYHFVRNHIENGTIRILAVNSEDQLADFLTKALNFQELMRQVRRIMQVIE